MKKIKVAIAMSGGIDSSVAAALLKEQGFDVEGFFLNLFNSKHFEESKKRAKKIAGILKIPFFVVDLRKEFKKEIIGYFLEELKKGKTPNPCVLCNKEIKLGFLLDKIRKKGFNFLATGHYVKKVKSQKSKVKSYKLLKAKDKNKDQSYFLWMLKQEQLSHILFPIGEYTKKEVKNLAKKFGLPVFSKESQEICFIQKDLDKFLKKNFKIQKGDIIDSQGKIIGQHQGLWFYTIGQRRAIGLSGGPFYVLGKDIQKNILIVTKNEKDLYKKKLKIEKNNWISGKKPKMPLKAKVKIRYRHKMANAILTQNSKLKAQNLYKLIFDKNQRAITPGQSTVFYFKNEVLGGGIIK